MTIYRTLKFITNKALIETRFVKIKTILKIVYKAYNEYSANLLLVNNDKKDIT